jgi:pimeloyl-ACP methyl ester carboxylesterase
MLACLLAWSAVPARSSVIPPLPPNSWYHGQKLDHFNALDNRTFSQRYLVYDELWDPATGGIIVYMGNEEPIESFWLNTGWPFANANSLGGALVLFIEHRFFGQTFPGESLQQALYDPSLLGHLNVEQVLADAVQLLNDVLPQMKAQGRPVIAIGGSYGASLAAWARMKYPGTFHAALAGSALMNCFAPETNEDGFFDIVAGDFFSPQTAPPVGGLNCGEVIAAAFARAQSLSASSNGRALLQSQLNPCSPFDSPDDVSSFLFFAQNVLVNTAMLSYPVAVNFTHVIPANPLNKSCLAASTAAAAAAGLDGAARVDALRISDEALLQGLNAAIGVWANSSGDAQCYNASTSLRCSDPTSCGDGLLARAWAYLACMDMVIAQGPSGKLFPAAPFNQTWLNQYCVDQFGAPARIDWAYRTFGVPASLAGTSNIVFSNGLIDPWHGCNIVESVSDTVRAIVIPEAAHHLDLRPPTANDSAALIAARELEVSLLQQWTGLSPVKK